MPETTQTAAISSALEVTVAIGTRQVIGSGSVVLCLDEDVTLTISDLKFVVSLAEDGEKGRVVYNANKEAKTLNITGFNFATMGGTASAKPQHVGNVSGKKLYLQLAARRFAKAHSGSCLLYYTFSLEA